MLIDKPSRQAHLCIPIWYPKMEYKAIAPGAVPIKTESLEPL